MDTATIDKNIWTIPKLINWSSEYLTSKDFESPRLVTELLLAHVIGCDRIDLYTNFDKQLTSDELAKFKSLFKRCLTHEPLQYIIGEAEFMGLKFNVDKRVLIPRPETEILVEQVIKYAKTNPDIKNILDIGTGSGCIAISLVKHIKEINIDAIDINNDALEVARINCKKHKVEDLIQFFEADVMNLSGDLLDKYYDVIVSNPPYISKSEFESLSKEVRDFEPQSAYYDKSDGLTYYRAIAKNVQSLLKTDGWIFVEVGYNQSNDVEKIFQEADYKDVESIRDYSDIKRVIKAQWKK